MGRPRDGGDGSPRAASSSSSDFEFTVSLSPSSKRLSSQLCPADELFYKGQLLPLQLSPRISMVRTLLLSSSSTSSSSDTATSASRDSNGSTSSSFSTDLLLLPTDSDSSRPSSVTDEDYSSKLPSTTSAKRPKYYFSSFATRFSSVFLHRGGSKKDSSSSPHLDLDAKKPNSAKEVIKKCVKKVKPFYDKLKQSNTQSSPPPPPPPLHPNITATTTATTKKTFSFSIRKDKLTPISSTTTTKKRHDDDGGRGGVICHRRAVYVHSNSFSGNLKFPRKKMVAASCPSSMRSSPSHSGLLCNPGGAGAGFSDLLPPVASSSSASSMEELHSAIQGAIAHCKSSMIQGDTHKKSAATATATASGGDEEVHAY